MGQGPGSAAGGETKNKTSTYNGRMILLTYGSE